MENQIISNQEELLEYIEDLKFQKFNSEYLLKSAVEESFNSFGGLKIVKTIVHQITNDSELKNDLLKLTHSSEANYMQNRMNENEVTNNNVVMNRV